MSFEYEYFEDQGYLITKVPETALLTDALAHFDKLINDPSIRKPFFEIVDFSKTREIEFGYDQSNLLLSKIASLQAFENYQGSFLIAHSDYIRGMANIYRVVAGRLDIDVIQVGSLEEALDAVANHFSL